MGRSQRRATPKLCGRCPSIAALTRSGARKASDTVMLTLRTLHWAPVAMLSVVAAGSSISSSDDERGDGTLEVAPDLAYRRLAIVNVVFVGKAGANDRGWVLIDTGIAGTKSF